MKKKITLCILLTIITIFTLSACNTNYKWKSFDEYSNFLKEDNEFITPDTSLPFIPDYSFDTPSLAVIREKYELHKIAGDGSELDKTLKLLEWASTKIKYDGGVYAKVEIMDGEHLLEYGYQTGNAMNCMQKAILLDDCLRSVGLKSRTLYIMPKEANTNDNHVVNHVYIDELSKWIMIDPSHNSYFIDANGIILDAFELRETFANKVDVTVNEASDATYSNLKKYCVKNLYWFMMPVTPTLMAYAMPTATNINDWHLNEKKHRHKLGALKKSELQNWVDFLKTVTYPLYSLEDLIKV